MKLIESSAEYIPQEEGLEGVYKQIERAARVCYKSEAKCDGTYESAKKFVDKLIERGHTAMLEQGTVYLHLPKGIDADWDVVKKYEKDGYSCIVYYIEGSPVWYSHFVITTNLRVLQENNWLDDLQYICEPNKHHRRRYTLKLVTSIGITRELIRHKLLCVA